LYDWAYGAFNVVVSTFVFATYFVRAVAPDAATGTAQWAGAQAAAGIVVAVLAAPLGAIADLSGRKRPMLALFTTTMALATAALWFVRPLASDVTLALGLVVIATVSYELATVFYNAMLPDLAPPFSRADGSRCSVGPFLRSCPTGTRGDHGASRSGRVSATWGACSGTPPPSRRSCGSCSRACCTLMV
jgi:UMF1 family MFS transporter